MDAEPTTIAVPTRDGRSLETIVAGPDDGTVLVFHHGSPGAAASYAPFTKACAERDIRLVLYSRPGFGGSTMSVLSFSINAAACVSAIFCISAGDGIWGGAVAFPMAGAELMAASVTGVAGLCDP